MKIDIMQLEFIDLTLRKICVWLEEETGFEFIGTSLFRINDPGVHGQLPLRGVDIRMRNKKVGKVIEELVNENWVYDPMRWKMHCALLHGEGMNLHLHLQSHPKTEKRVKLK